MNAEKAPPPMPAAYHRSDCDVVLLELEALPPWDPTEPDDAVAQRLEEREQQLHEVERRLYTMVMQHYGEFVDGMKNVQQITEILNDTSRLCSQARGHLRRGREIAVTGSLDILRKRRRKAYLQQVLANALVMRKIMRAVEDANALLKADKFEELREHLQQFKREQKAGDGLVAVQGFCSNEWHDGMERAIFARLYDLLFECCGDFQPDRFVTALNGLQSFGRMYDVGKLQKAFLDSFDTAAREAVLAHCPEPQRPELLPQPFPAQCQAVPAERAAECALRVCQALQHVLTQFQRMYHFSELAMQPPPGEARPSWAQEVRQALVPIRKSIAGVVQRKVEDLLKAVTGTVPLDRFLAILHCANLMQLVAGRATAAGKQGQPAPPPDPAQEEALIARFADAAKQSVDRFHATALGKLKDYILAEEWTPQISDPNTASDLGFLRLPVVTSLQLCQRALAAPAPAPPAAATGDDADAAATNGHGPAVQAVEPFKAALEGGRTLAQVPWTHLFDAAGEADPDPPRLLEFELEPEFGAGDTPPPPPPASPTHGGEPQPPARGFLLTTTTRWILRQLGHYASALLVMPYLAERLFQCMEELVGAYLYVVFVQFGTTQRDRYVPDKDPALPEAPVRQRLQLYRLRAQEAAGGIDVAERAPAGAAAAAQGAQNIFCASAALANQLYISDFMFGLSKRVGACLSLSAPCRAVRAFATVLLGETHAAGAARLQVREQCQQAVALLETIARVARDVAMQRLTHSLFVMYAVPKAVQKKAQWAPKPQEAADRINNVNEYVDIVRKEIAQFQQRLDRTGPQSAAPLPLPHEVVPQLWRLAIYHLWDSLVEGYSLVEKCNEIGRSQMIVDLRNIEQELLAASRLPAVPAKDYVEQFITAWWNLPKKQDVQEFIRRAAGVYSARQLGKLLQLDALRDALKAEDRKELLGLAEAVCGGGGPNGAGPGSGAAQAASALGNPLSAVLAGVLRHPGPLAPGEVAFRLNVYMKGD